MWKSILGLAAAACSATVCAKPFSFIAFGDTAYLLPRDTPRLERLITAINGERPDFSIHVGDFKGYTSCSDEAYRAQIALFRRLDAPLLLTPGDNDWADCGVDTAGKFKPLERLASLHRLFYAGPRSLGGATLEVDRQPGFPENARWSRDGVTFATVHVIGPHNGLIRNTDMAADSIARSEAGESWIREAFALARRSHSPAVVLAFQADAWLASAPTYEQGPLDWLRNAIGEEAGDFAGQVLVVHGDSHRLTIDTPYRRANIDAGTTTGLNVTRLMVPGWPDHRAVRVDVDPARPGMFKFSIVMAAEESAGARP